MIRRGRALEAGPPGIGNQEPVGRVPAILDGFRRILIWTVARGRATVLIVADSCSAVLWNLALLMNTAFELNGVRTDQYMLGSIHTGAIHPQAPRWPGKKKCRTASVFSGFNFP